jgi:hypothetical protein
VDDGAKGNFNYWATVRNLGRGRKEKGDVDSMDALHLAPFGRALPKKILVPF